MHLDREACYRALLTRDARFDGRFFIAVSTTGVYCRPICPARPPRLEHIVFLPTAAAAQEAGFRPCLRCRPECAPDLAAWRGTSRTVSRAVELIEAGELNDDGVAGLAGRLGLGERQLRRLFRQHLGATPKAVAQTRRVLLAKRLITDTQLPLTQVAFAAGFGSVRRFNDTFQKLYGRPPQRLRRAAGDDERLTSAITLTLPFKPPYDWPALLHFLAARAIPGVEYVDDDRYERTIALGGARGTIVVGRSASGEASNSVVATIRFPVITALPTIIDRIRGIFDLGADPAAIGAQLSVDPTLAPLVAARPGLRVPGAWDAFELAVRAILEEQMPVGVAALVAGKLAAAYGPRLRPSGAADALRFVFPGPEHLASAELDVMPGMPRACARAIASLTAAATRNPALFSASKGLDDTIARLAELAGIANGTAHYIAMRALREPNAFPLPDRSPLGASTTSERRSPSSELLTRATAWRPWRAYAALYLWSADATIPACEEKRRETVARSNPLSDRNDSARVRRHGTAGTGFRGL